MNGDHYAYRVRWSDEDEAYIATVAEMPSLSWAADNHTDALAGLRTLADDVLEDMQDNGETPPKEIVAAKQNASRNRLVSARLASGVSVEYVYVSGRFSRGSH